MIHAFVKIKRCPVEIGQRQSQQFRSVLGKNLDGTGDGTRRRSSGKPLPSTVREVDCHTDCLGADSDEVHHKEPEELLEVEGSGLRRSARPAAKILSWLGREQVVRKSNPSPSFGKQR